MESLEPLILSARAGDLSAYGLIVGRFQDMAYGYAYSILGDFHLAEDAAQEAFLEAYVHLGSLRCPAAFPGWFRRIVFKHCDRLRRRRGVRTVPLDKAAAVASPEPPPSRSAQDRETGAGVLEAVRSLPDGQRTVTTLFYINGYSHSEIAEFLDVPVGTVKSRLHSSRSRLKERLVKMMSDELKSRSLPGSFPEHIQKLLSLPHPLDVPGHPVREAWDAFRSALPDFEVVEFDEVLPRSASHIPPELMSKIVHEIDERRILRHDLSVGLTGLWVDRGGGPCRLMAAGRTFRKGWPDSPHSAAEVFHQAETLWVREGLDQSQAEEMARRVARAVLGEVDVQVGDITHIGEGIVGVELTAQWQGEHLEFGVAGLHSEGLLRRGGLDPSRYGGICLALGLERCALIRHDIDDIRKLWQPPYIPG